MITALQRNIGKVIFTGVRQFTGVTPGPWFSPGVYPGLVFGSVGLYPDPVSGQAGGRGVPLGQDSCIQPDFD